MKNYHEPATKVRYLNLMVVRMIRLQSRFIRHGKLGITVSMSVAEMLKLKMQLWKHLEMSIRFFL